MDASFAMLVASNESQTTASNETASTTTLIESLGPVYLNSGIFIAVLSIVATFGNGLLLLAIWKDPYRTFRVPPTVLVTGLAVADFLTGFLVGPAIAYVRIAPQSERHTKRFTVVGKAGKTLSFLTMNASYFVLLFLTWNQFAAVRFPHQHRNFISNRKVTVCVVGIWLYAISFSLLPFCGIDPEIVNKLDFYMHTTVFIVLLVIAYLCLFFAFQNQVHRITLATTQHSVHGANHARRQGLGFTRSRKRSERQFTILTLVLVSFIIICTLPSLILQLLTIYWTPTSFEEKRSILIALEVCSDVLFLKFALDPFIYCWRLASYRKALKSVLMFGRVSVVRENPFSFTKTAQPRRGMANCVMPLSSGRRESYMMSIQQGSATGRYDDQGENESHSAIITSLRAARL
ncbi:melanocyte-stimulating hormone receptor-like [Actinia tenebrosa]|uniref:Melanocyte-stimulating hormone receptor-like n=1 Tax=Actinia tenebrosa TaxID=6105 RepID=A0A6P8HRL5_ACTTE|nr:melanocyte-stimulating hormone receptor-like [Actinia tenebrosa]